MDRSARSCRSRCSLNGKYTPDALLFYSRSMYKITDKEHPNSMRHSAARITFLLSLFSVILNAQQALTNDAILKLVKAGITEDTIITIVNHEPGNYAVAAPDIAALKAGGASEKVIAAMVVRSSAGVGSAITLHDASGKPVQIAIAADAGNPAPIVLPTKTAPVGGLLMSNGQNPQRTVWATLGRGLMVAGNTLSLNTAVLVTNFNASAGKPWYCKSSGSDPINAYTCSLNAAAALTSYTDGMFLLLNAGTTNTGPSTLNVDGVGLAAILQKDGASQLTAGQLAAGQAQWIWYDGRAFRLMY